MNLSMLCCHKVFERCRLELPATIKDKNIIVVDDQRPESIYESFNVEIINSKLYHDCINIYSLQNLVQSCEYIDLQILEF